MVTVTAVQCSAKPKGSICSLVKGADTLVNGADTASLITGQVTIYSLRPLLPARGWPLLSIETH